MINTTKYEYDCELLFKQLTPSSFYINNEGAEKEKYVKLLYAIGSVFSPIKQIIYEKILYINNEISYNWELKQLERRLNDDFDSSLRRITIINNEVGEFFKLDLYKDGEVDPTPVDLYIDGETDPTPLFLFDDNIYETNFTVYLNGVIVEGVRLQSIVDKYKKINKTYNYV